MTTLSEAQVEHYRTHGWIAPLDLMSQAEAAELLGLLEAAEQAHPAELHAEHRNNAHLAFPFLGDLAVDRRIIEAVEPLVGVDLCLSSTVLFIKEPDSAAFVSWHQDAFYMGLEPDNFVTAWVALTASTSDNGCVAVLPGTHKGRAGHHDTFGEDNILTRGQTVTEVDESAAVDLELRPGQMSLHHPWLVHGSRPNRTANRRVGIAMQSYLGADVRPVGGDYYVVPVQGAAPHESFISAPLPAAAVDPAAVTVRANANAALSSVLYRGAEQTRAL